MISDFHAHRQCSTLQSLSLCARSSWKFPSSLSSSLHQKHPKFWVQPIICRTGIIEYISKWRGGNNLCACSTSISSGGKLITNAIRRKPKLNNFQLNCCFNNVDHCWFEISVTIRAELYDTAVSVRWWSIFILTWTINYDKLRYQISVTRPSQPWIWWLYRARELGQVRQPCSSSAVR